MQMRDEAWQYHHSLEAAIHANAEAAETSNASRTADVNSMKDELTAAQERTASTVEALEEANAKADKYLAEKQEAENARKSIDARCVALQSENEHLRQAMSDSRLREREWRKERSKILAELDKNTSSAILRREELYLRGRRCSRSSCAYEGSFEKKPAARSGASGITRHGRPRRGSDNAHYRDVEVVAAAACWERTRRRRQNSGRRCSRRTPSRRASAAFTRRPTGRRSRRHPPMSTASCRARRARSTRSPSLRRRCCSSTGRRRGQKRYQRARLRDH